MLRVLGPHQGLWCLGMIGSHLPVFFLILSPWILHIFIPHRSLVSTDSFFFSLFSSNMQTYLGPDLILNPVPLFILVPCSLQAFSSLPSFWLPHAYSICSLLPSPLIPPDSSTRETCLLPFQPVFFNFGVRNYCRRLEFESLFKTSLAWRSRLQPPSDRDD